MSDNKHTGRGWNGKGYYIALILCAAAIGITSYVYSRNAETPEEVLLQESEVIPVGTMTAVEDIPVISLKGLKEMKLSLGREKDLRDVALIDAYLASRG